MADRTSTASSLGSSRAQGKAARVKIYAYGEIEQALADLTTGGCDAFMKLAPVTAWLVRDRPRLKVVETSITREILGMYVRRGDDACYSAWDLDADRRLKSLIHL